MNTQRRKSLRFGLGVLLCVCLLGTGPAASMSDDPHRSLSPSPSGTPVLAPAQGDIMPSFDAEGVDGVKKHLVYSKGSVTVLLFFLSSCPTCHKMIPEWNKAFENRPKNLEVIGVLMDKEPPGFFMSTPVSFPVVRAPSRDFLNTYKVHRAPLALRIGPGGKVEDVGVGVLDPIRLGEIFRR